MAYSSFHAKSEESILHILKVFGHSYALLGNPGPKSPNRCGRVANIRSLRPTYRCRIIVGAAIIFNNLDPEPYLKHQNHLKP